MEDKSVFLEREGYAPKNKVLDFLIVAQDFDYSLKDIAEHSKISYPCMKQLKKELIEDGWITLTRKVGKAQMHKLNLKNKKVQKFIDFFWAVVNEEVERKLGVKQEETDYATVPSVMPVSARHA
ncbi:MAG: hypothetical protein Q8R04_06395 [Nanoarchaeota archaeon]|nr:hypothetical protein [Nanoarchaeota archaeon]